jgi:hypothetical protein
MAEGKRWMEEKLLRQGRVRVEDIGVTLFAAFFLPKLFVYLHLFLSLVLVTFRLSFPSTLS